MLIVAVGRVGAKHEIGRLFRFLYAAFGFESKEYASELSKVSSLYGKERDMLLLRIRYTKIFAVLPTEQLVSPITPRCIPYENHHDVF